MVALGKVLSFCYASLVFMILAARFLLVLGAIGLVVLAAFKVF